MHTVRINTKSRDTATAILENDECEEIGREEFDIDPETDDADWYDVAEKLATDHFSEYDISRLVCDGHRIY